MRILPLVFLPLLVQAATHSFQVRQPGEAIAELELISKRSDWSERGREAAVARIQVDGGAPHQLMVFGHERRYRVFLGRLEPGRHTLEVTRHATLSAPGSDLKVGRIRVETVAPGDDLFDAVAHAPVVLARPGAVEAFSDVPMLAYCERVRMPDGGWDIQYTIIFSNEDGGTSTRALMARWGRTTDIEYVYRVRLNAAGQAVTATYQAKDHKDLAFGGKRDGAHPYLYVSTLNNMVAEQGESALRFQLAPALYDLSASSREKTMDDRAILYRIASEELVREGKLRAYGTVDGQKISDPRNYAIVEARLKREQAAVAFLFRVKGEVFRSDLGRADYAIDRDGWARSATELPPGTKADEIENVSFECVSRDPSKAGRCEVMPDMRLYLLDRDYRPIAVRGVRTSGGRAPLGGGGVLLAR